MVQTIKLKLIYAAGSPSRFEKSIIFLYAKRILDKLRNTEIRASIYSLSSLRLMKLHHNRSPHFHSLSLKKWRLLKNVIAF